MACWSAVNRPVSGPIDPHSRIRYACSCFSLVPNDCRSQPGISVATATPNTFNATLLVQACGQLRCRLLICLASRPSDAHTHAHQSTIVRVTHGHSGPQPLASWSVVPVSPSAPCSPPLASRSVARGCAPPRRVCSRHFSNQGPMPHKLCPPRQGLEQERGRYVRRQSRGRPISQWMVQPLTTWTEQWSVGNSRKFASGVFGCTIACQSSFSPVLHQSDSRRCAVTRVSAMVSGQLRLL